MVNPDHLVIRLVLPTDWSPRRTIFVFLRGEDVNSEVAGVVGDAMIIEWRRGVSQMLWPASYDATLN